MAKQADVEVGQIWTARVSGRRVHVRVDSIIKRDPYSISSMRKRKQYYSLTNLTTKRSISRTAAFLRVKVS